MSKKREIDPAYYDTHCFGGEMIEAKKNGALIVTRPGESAIEAIKRYREAQKKVSVAARVPAGLLSKAKAQSVAAG
jgi:hypothetical protein